MPKSANGNGKVKVIESASDITYDAANANKGTDRGQKLLAGSLTKYGAGRSILVDQHGTVIAGNKTLAQANSLNLPVRVIQTDGSELVVVQRTDLDIDSPKGRELAYSDNRVGQVDLEWNPDQLLADVNAGIDLSSLFGKDDLDAILRDAEGYGGGAQDDPGADIDKAAELQLKWGTELGQLWAIGRHRLLCGDCTVRENVERVMGGEKAGAVVTDVPYGISQSSNGLRKLDYGEWDDATATRVALAGITLCSDIPTITAFCGDEQLSVILSQWTNRTKRTVVWSKPNPTVINGEHVFLPACELAAHGRLAGAWFGGKCVRSVWDGSVPHERDHPTQKPIELFVWLVELTCEPGGIVYDPFLGSGTTLVACEQLGRIGRGLELSPAYCAVILERLSGMGLTPEQI